jgi:hypothetical protein
MTSDGSYLFARRNQFIKVSQDGTVTKINLPLEGWLAPYSIQYGTSYVQGMGNLCERADGAIVFTLFIRDYNYPWGYHRILVGTLNPDGTFGDLIPLEDPILDYPGAPPQFSALRADGTLVIIIGSSYSQGVYAVVNLEKGTCEYFRFEDTLYPNEDGTPKYLSVDPWSGEFSVTGYKPIHNKRTDDIIFKLQTKNEYVPDTGTYSIERGLFVIKSDNTLVELTDIDTRKNTGRISLAVA